MKKIKEIINCDYDIYISGITNDSRQVKKDYLFVATKGFNVDHFNYINDAIKNGCSVVIADRDIDISVPLIKVKDINNLYYKLCERFYNINLNDFSFIGITGTDGKTTTATIVKQLLNNINKTAYIGTNGVEIGDKSLDINNTTPCISELYNVLEKSREKKCSDIVMEVSSEALLHDRIKNIKYDIVAFTNITEDHLNVHKTLKNYVNCKKKLLNNLKDCGVAIVNGDDKYCKKIEANTTVKFGFDSNNDCVINNVELLENMTKFTIKYLGNSYDIKSPFLGLYNVYNLTMAFLICIHFGLSAEYLVDTIPNLKVVKGRREKLDFGQNFEIILDYAHTLNGIINIIESIDKNRKIIVVTGCAGGREKSKRKKIGKYILEHVNQAIFTMDDPRYEDVNDIIDDMVGNSNIQYLRIIDRKEAIYKSFELADCDTTVLILGKGRDNYMAIEDKKVSYCDYDVISKYFDK